MNTLLRDLSLMLWNIQHGLSNGSMSQDDAAEALEPIIEKLDEMSKE